MHSIRRLWAWITLASVEPDLAVAQFNELQGQIPLLYALLCVNALALSYTHFGLAPAWMAIWVPAILIVASLGRMFVWLKRSSDIVDASLALKNLRRTALLACVLASAYIAWSLTMNGYGGEREHAHVALFIAITVIGCIFCLMHLPQAALAVSLIVTVPYLCFYFWMRDAVYAAIAINILLVTVVMIRVLLNTFGGFRSLIETQAETKRLNREVTVLAHTDILTGLPNRRLFFAELESKIEQFDGTKFPISMGVIDLDRFKSANDTFGHLVGDRLLEIVGKRLKDIFGADHLVARLGGDEFAFLVDADGAQAIKIANHACMALAEPFEFDEQTITIGASCGVATIDDATTGGRSLYDMADYALYNAKSEGRGFATLYSAEHADRIRTERAIEIALQAANLDIEMDVHFQPIIRISDGTVMAVEALARWNSPELGNVRPDIFIPLAERAGIVRGLTLTLLCKTLRHFERLPPTMRVSFNLSAHDLACSETVLGIISLIRRSAIEPSRIIMELTETAVLRDFVVAKQSIELLRAMGILIALDDFGTGQSSLSYLHKLPINKVKIDRSFVRDSDTPPGRDLLTAVVLLCRSMRMGCIAEGVENERQLEIIRDIGCDAYQGYLFAKPMPVEEFLKQNYRTPGELFTLSSDHAGAGQRRLASQGVGPLSLAAV